MVEVEYTEWTEEGLLRQPVFLRFREDKRPEECVRQGGAGSRRSAERSAERMRRSVRCIPSRVGRGPRAGTRSGSAGRDPELPFELTNLKKLFWPDDGYTKGDLHRLLPRHLALAAALPPQPAGRA